MFNGGNNIIFKQFANLPNVPIFSLNDYHPAKGCAIDANCPLDRPVCGAGLLIDASGSGSGGVKFKRKCQEIDSVDTSCIIGGSGIEDPHACGCFTDSDCAGLTATLDPGLTAICEDRVCVEGCR